MTKEESTGKRERPWTSLFNRVAMAISVYNECVG